MQVSPLQKIFFLLILLASVLSCNQPSAAGKTESSLVTDNTSVESATSDTITITARFEDFVFGDAEHYYFTDEKGNQFDFGGCEDCDPAFSSELPEKEANETNQGWGPNKNLQNKWFRISYISRKQPLYPDGPEDLVNIIVKAKEVR
jgi:hypothetical protein